jgi:hypothetical protein
MIAACAFAAPVAAQAPATALDGTYPGVSIRKGTSPASLPVPNAM